ncbi:unnamed protein product [Diatraea saccharalis]|uniref:Conserved oligomeric Golgi complex subunit 7 n=1 Tax=Diatraea saccharalis TaxID=40085 RepID=A0A9P0C7S8_9NEOP|nr:unnamed protein product [Diatraea saccharalis]
MDLKTFAEDDFDPKKWINNAWSTSGNQEKEVFLANAVSRLQLYMKQLTNSLDETTTQIVSSIPRVLQEASSLHQEGALLQQQLESLQEMARGVEQQTGHSIQSLHRIDYLKTKLENAASALREADKWTALAIALEDILEAGVPTEPEKLAQLAEQVTAMTASLEVLSDAPDYENKRVQLETLYNRLEVAITSPLIEALTQMNASKTSSYVSVFAGMSRHKSVFGCWARAGAGRVAAAWRRLEAPSTANLVSLLAPDASTQLDWLTNVLKCDTPLAELLKLYTGVMMSLEPSPTKVVSANLKLCSTPEEGILMLTDLRSDIDGLINCVKAVIDAPRQNKEIIPPVVIKEFGRAAYAPLRESLPKYTELQTQLLLVNLKDPQLEQDDLLERSRGLLSIAERCEGWISNAYNRSKKIAGVAGYPYYISAVDSLITAVTNLISSHSRHVEAAFLSSLKEGDSGGVLSVSFPASLVLEAAAATLLDTLADVRQLDGTDAEPKDQHPLSELTAFLLEADVIQRLPTLRAEPWGSIAALKRTKEQLRGLGKAILRNPIDVQLDKIPQLPVWNNNDALSTDLPDFALSPQEYITEIGQYLMTLPQHLEMHISEKQAPWQFLSEVCTHTCELYAEKILNIRNMDALGTKRCLTDIVYLSSVVEDLGSNVTPALKNLEKSLRAATPGQSE